MNRILTCTALGATAAVGLFSLAAYRSVSKVPRRSISVYDDVPESFAKSHAVRKFVNPNGHPLARDSRSITLHGSRLSHLSDEVLLARFVKGFFGGWIFTPERYALKAANISAGPFPGLKPGPSIWNISDLSDTTLPPISTPIFGAFQLADISLIDHTKTESSESSVDIVFGSPSSTFAGCHRLSIQRNPAEADKVTLTLSCVAGNPTQNKPMNGGALLTFHRTYAMLLFKDAVAAM